MIDKSEKSQWRDDSMIREIENRRSIRKYKPDELDRKLIEEIIYSASLADRKSTRLNSSHGAKSRMPSSA